MSGDDEGTPVRTCPRCGWGSTSAGPGGSRASSDRGPATGTRCPGCGLDLAAVYLPYPTLALAVVLGLRMVEAAGWSLVAVGLVDKVLALILAVVLGASVQGLVTRRSWARLLILGVAVPVAIYGLVVIVTGGADGAAVRLLAEGGGAAVWLLGPGRGGFDEA